MTGEPTHTALKERNDTMRPQLYQSLSKVKYLLHFVVSFVQPVTQ